MTAAVVRQAAVRPDARARSLELAEAHGETVCSQHVHTLGWALDERGALIQAAWTIDSASTPEGAYTVSYDAREDDGQCECPAAQYGRPCWHRGLAVLMGRAMARAYSDAGMREARLEQR